jgi:hypothetical protein
VRSPREDGAAGAVSGVQAATDTAIAVQTAVASAERPRAIDRCRVDSILKLDGPSIHTTEVDISAAGILGAE